MGDSNKIVRIYGEEDSLADEFRYDPELNDEQYAIKPADFILENRIPYYQADIISSVLKIDKKEKGWKHLQEARRKLGVIEDIILKDMIED